MSQIVSRRGASDSVTDSSVLSNPADAQNVSCLGLLTMGRVLSIQSYYMIKTNKKIKKL